MATNNRISTIIPTFRRPQLLGRAIRSVLSQNYPDFEVHVYDNASGDETPEVVAALAARDPRIKYHCHQRNIGIMENFAYGIEHVCTPFFNILSDDDFILTGFFEAAIDALTADPSLGFFFGGLLYFDGRQVIAAPADKWNFEGRVESTTMFRALFPGRWITWTSSFFRTQAVTKAGGLRPELGYGGDVELLLRLAVRNAGFVWRNPCAVMNLHHGSASAADGGLEYSAEKLLTIFESVYDTIARARDEGAISPEDAGLLQTIVGADLDWWLFRQALILLAQGHRLSAAQVAETLDVRCGRSGLAKIVRLIAGTNPLGWSIRGGLRSLRLARGNLRCRAREWQYGHYAGVVENARDYLEAKIISEFPNATSM